MRRRSQTLWIRLLVGIIMIFSSIFVMLSLFGVLGGVGTLIKNFMFGVFGYAVYGYSACFILIGGLIMFGVRAKLSVGKFFEFISLYVLGMVAVQVFSSGSYLDGTYVEYLGACYTNGKTIGGAMYGSLSYPLMKWLTINGALILVAVIFLGLAFVYLLPHLKKEVSFKKKTMKITKTKRPTLTDFANGKKVKAKNLSAVPSKKTYAEHMPEQEYEDEDMAKLYHLDVDSSFLPKNSRAKRKLKGADGYNFLFPNMSGHIEDEKKNLGSKNLNSIVGTSLAEQFDEDAYKAYLDSTKKANISNTASVKQNKKIELPKAEPKIAQKAMQSKMAVGAVGAEIQSKGIADTNKVVTEINQIQGKQISDGQKKYTKADFEVKNKFNNGYGVINPDKITMAKANAKKFGQNLEEKVDVKQTAQNEPIQEKITLPKQAKLNPFGEPILPKEFKKKEDWGKTRKTDAISFEDWKKEELENIKVVSSKAYVEPEKKNYFGNDKEMRERIRKNEEIKQAKLAKSKKLGAKEIGNIDFETQKSNIAKSNLANAQGQENLNKANEAQKAKSENQSKIEMLKAKFKNKEELNNITTKKENQASGQILANNTSQNSTTNANSLNKLKTNIAKNVNATNSQSQYKSNVGNVEKRANSNNTESYQRKSQFENENKRAQYRNEQPQRQMPSVKKAETDDKYKDMVLANGRQYIAPPLNLLINPEPELASPVDIEEKRDTLIRTLADFNINAEVMEVVCGPSFSMYVLHVEMPRGRSIGYINSLDSDIAMKMRAVDVRILAPIPGRDAVGVEIPNERKRIVRLKEIIDSPKFNDSNSPFTFALGKDIYGDVHTMDIKKLPHLLIAGATGSGKSCGLNSLIVSLLYKSSPDDLKMIMIDPKMVELGMYNRIPHLLLGEIIIDVDKAIKALNWVIGEMDRRIVFLADQGFQNIEEYNKYVVRDNGRTGLRKLPRIVVIIDELADLMDRGKKSVEDSINRLTRLARATGIHLIVATQRPSVDVISGTIKNNFPSRIAFKVTSLADSRTVLDGGGADKLLGNGDMLLMDPHQSVLERIQGSFISGEEVKNVVRFIIENNNADFSESAKKEIFAEEEPERPKKGGRGRRDKLPIEFFKAIEIGLNGELLSTTLLQRRLGIGFPKAGGIIDQLVQRKYIGEQAGSNRGRKILISREEFEDLLIENNISEDDLDLY